MGFLRKLFQSDDKKTMTIVSGLPRSGTSMMMKMLEAGGIPPLTDEIREADADNPQGYYEFERVKKLDKGDSEWLATAEGKSVKVISALLQHLPTDYEYRVIFMERHMPEILASQRKMLDRRGEVDEMEDEKMQALFAKHLQQVKEWLAEQKNFSVLYVHYSEALADARSQAERVKAFLGADLDVDLMTATVDPKLYRNRQEEIAGG